MPHFSVIYEAILNAHDAKRTVFHAISYVQATPTQCSIVKLWKNSRKSINTNLLHKSRSTFTWPKNNPKIYEIWKLEIRLLIWILSTTQLFKHRGFKDWYHWYHSYKSIFLYLFFWQNYKLHLFPKSF